MSRRFSLRRNVRSEIVDRHRNNYKSPSPSPAPLDDQEDSESANSRSNSSMSADHGSDDDNDDDNVDDQLTNQNSTRHLFVTQDDQVSLAGSSKSQNLPKNRSRMSSSSSTQNCVFGFKYDKMKHLELNLCQSSSYADPKARSLFDVSKCADESPDTQIEKDPFLMVKFVRPSTSAIAISERQKEARDAVLSKFDHVDD